tara:strand:- start:507 stop:941 length:435 start_codon:yes stop_codon:yes gene_type:complete
MHHTDPCFGQRAELARLAADWESRRQAEMAERASEAAGAGEAKKQHGRAQEQGDLKQDLKQEAPEPGQGDGASSLAPLSLLAPPDASGTGALLPNWYAAVAPPTEPGGAPRTYYYCKTTRETTFFKPILLPASMAQPKRHVSSL